LENEFLNDKWFTYKFHKLTPSPKRWAHKNSREIKNQYQFTFCTNFVIGALLTWPLAVLVGRRWKRTQGGVPAVPFQRFIHDFPIVEPTYMARRSFDWGFRLTCISGGLMFAFMTTDKRQMSNPWYNRPDLKPYPAMVPQKDLDITQKTALFAHYQSNRNTSYSSDVKRRTWYRVLFPNDADYSVKENPYSQYHKDDIYNPANGYYSSPTNHFRDHVNE
jgi:hypothetical protein